MKRFLPWLVPIVCLLVAIPVLLIAEAATAAKIGGVVVVVLTTVAIRFWLFNANRQRISNGRVKLTINERYFLNESFPYYKGMSKAGKKSLEERTGLLLAELSFDRYDHKEVSKEDCLAFGIVLSLLVQDNPYTSCQAKIVVFWEKETSELGMQGDQKLLFINKTTLYGALKAFSGNNMESLIPAETAENSLLFYRS